MLQRFRGNKEGISLLPSQSLGQRRVNHSSEAPREARFAVAVQKLGLRSGITERIILGQGQSSLEENILG